MKFTVNRSELLKKLRDVQLAISNKTTIPILTGLKLEATRDGLKLTGSNSDISIETKLFVEDEQVNLEVEETEALFYNPLVSLQILLIVCQTILLLLKSIHNYKHRSLRQIHFSQLML